MQAIVTKYLGPTNFRGSRIKASADAGSVTIPWDHALNSESNHTAAARALACKFGWLGPNDPIGQSFHERFVGGTFANAWHFVRVK